MALHRAWPITGVDLAYYLLDYRGAVQSYVLAAKNGGRRDVLAFFGRRLGLMLSHVDDVLPANWRPTVVWVPAGRLGRRRRGYDQSRLLAREVAGVIGAPVMPLLGRRGRHTQSGLDRAQRLVGPGIRCRVAAAPQHVLLVDDVITTGGSLTAAASALRLAGTTVVVAATVAAVDRARHRAVATNGNPFRPVARVAPGTGRQDPGKIDG